MCSHLSPVVSASLYWLSLSLSLHSASVTCAATWLHNVNALMTGQMPSGKLRSPLLTLHVEQLRPMQQQHSSEPRRNVWLVR